MLVKSLCAELSIVVGRQSKQVDREARDFRSISPNTSTSKEIMISASSKKRVSDRQCRRLVLFRGCRWWWFRVQVANFEQV